MSRFSWKGEVLVVDQTVVGSVSQGAGDGQWFAHGCMDDWEDTPLGCYETEEDAQKVALQWAEDHL